MLFIEDGSWYIFTDIAYVTLRYFIDDDGLHVLLLGANISHQKILNTLIMLESSTLADILCELNGWDRRTLRLHALELGLRY